MNLVCLDLEGVLVPEIWVAFAEATGIPELRRTTRDEPDYDKLMRYRIGHPEGARPGPAARSRTPSPRSTPCPARRSSWTSCAAMTQVVILSDTFEQFAQAPDGEAGLAHHLLQHAGGGARRRDHRLSRCAASSPSSRRCGRCSPCGYRHHRRRRQLQRPGHDPGQQGGLPVQEHRQAIKADHPELPAFEDFADLLAAIKRNL